MKANVLEGQDPLVDRGDLIFTGHMKSLEVCIAQVFLNSKHIGEIAKNIFKSAFG